MTMEMVHLAEIDAEGRTGIPGVVVGVPGLRQDGRGVDSAQLSEQLLLQRSAAQAPLIDLVLLGHLHQFRFRDHPVDVEEVPDHALLADPPPADRVHT
ncbi:hypothetical protein [Nonomuraea indica]|uniref:Calcineurin-like phosphoesterase domain-containing protein n=1 Tax=Nonomuraea indica TaxID=1581193 RepID=A0ABW8ADU6_9ACTN